jgi:hypothetical protein
MSFSGFEAGYVLSGGDDASLLKREKFEHQVRLKLSVKIPTRDEQ